MAEEKNTIGLSRDFIIHPGETLAEVIENAQMTQRELAARTGMTEKHISTVINGTKNISATFAKKLEYALGIEFSFWMNLQANYDKELLEFEELNNITEEETAVLKNLKDVITVWRKWNWLEADSNPTETVLDLRKILGVSNLCSIPKISYAASYRAQSNGSNVDTYVMFAWQRMCELLTKNIEVADQVDTDKLLQKIPEIKQAMFLRVNQVQKRLETIFAECGIAFKIVPNFTGAPVQGFIKKTDDGTVILCMTLRQKFADIFWFTLFHEISHILNGDTKNEFLDFASVSGKAEAKADKMAGEFLIEPQAYKDFVESGQYSSSSAIATFAKAQNVKDYIVEGRLMKDQLIPWRDRLKYEWAN